MLPDATLVATAIVPSKKILQWANDCFAAH